MGLIRLTWLCRRLPSFALLLFAFFQILGSPASCQSSSSGKFCLDSENLPLPGRLDDIPCFNSNSPELVLKEGILLSTFPSEGMRHPEAHLNYQFNGRFDIFAHHVARNESSEEDKTLYLGLIIGNPGNRRVRLQVLSAASYLSQPDAPFIHLPEVSCNNDGGVFAGPGDRVCNDVLRGRRNDFVPKSFSLKPGQDRLFVLLPVPVRKLRPALNGRSTLIKMRSSDPVYIALVAKFADSTNPIPEEKWISALYEGALAGPRDLAPSPPGFKGKIKYGRVAGVSRGVTWESTLKYPLISREKRPGFGAAPGKYSALKDETGSPSSAEETEQELQSPETECLNLPEQGKRLSFPLSTVEGGTYGTHQIQSAPMAVRYADTAYLNNGNYCVTYKLHLPLHNQYSRRKSVQVIFETAIKSDESDSNLCFFEKPQARVFFRGTVKCSDARKSTYWHLVQKQGQEGAKLAEFDMPAGSRKTLELEFLYPPDATPPQVLSICSLEAKTDEDPQQ